MYSDDAPILEIPTEPEKLSEWLKTAFHSREMIAALIKAAEDNPTIYQALQKASRTITDQRLRLALKIMSAADEVTGTQPLKFDGPGY